MPVHMNSHLQLFLDKRVQVIFFQALFKRQIYIFFYKFCWFWFFEFFVSRSFRLWRWPLEGGRSCMTKKSRSGEYSKEKIFVLFCFFCFWFKLDFTGKAINLIECRITSIELKLVTVRCCNINYYFLAGARIWRAMRSFRTSLLPP